MVTKFEIIDRILKTNIISIKERSTLFRTTELV